MDGLEPGEELRGDVLRLLEVQRPALLEHLEQRAAVDVLHRHQLVAVGLDEIEDPADVRGHDLAGGSDLAPQQVVARFILEEIRQQRLQRHLDPAA